MSRTRWTALVVGIIGVYFVAGRVGLGSFGLLHPSASPVWPPTGVAIAALLAYGRGVAPAIFVGAFLVNYTTAASLVESLGIAAGNTLEGLTAAYLVTRFAHGRETFDHALDIFKFAALAAVASTTISATIGVGVLALDDPAVRAQPGAIWLTWWLGDACGAMVVTPLLIAWQRNPTLRAPAWRIVEGALMLATIVAVTAALFFSPLLGRYPIAYLCLPPLVWAAFRFRQREVATAVVLMAVVATWATTIGKGPFVMATTNESLLVLQSFMATIAMTSLMMAALVQERATLFERERTALRRAEAALRSSDVFIAMLSHELRNPLSAIASAGELLQRATVQSEISLRAAGIIRRQTAHFTRLIEDLLDVARISAGKMTLRCEPVDLAETVANALQAPQAVDMRARPPIARELEPVWVDADPERLNQIVTNLLHNALKYTATGGTIRVRTCEEDGRGVLTVEDTGSGIAAELLPRVFDLFTQGEQGPDRAHGGLGLGLTLVRRLVELHSGDVEARSDGRGRGSTFVVRLPLAAAPATAIEPAGTAPAVAHACPILVIEDNADARESLRMLLESTGHAVSEAANGPAGVAHALKHEPRIALVDIGLPGFDGYEVARRIRSAKPGIRLVALTGYGRDEDKARAYAAGFDAHLVKPVELASLERVIARLLGERDVVRPRAPAG
jgi:signal transduction histidine kinase/ActR/RegA family two-component response regulator